MFRGTLWFLAGVALLIYTFPGLRGKRVREPLSPDQKIWRGLVVITSTLLIAVGIGLFLRYFQTKHG